MVEKVRMVSLAVVLVACGGELTETDGAPPGPSCDALFEGEPTLELEIGTQSDVVFTPWSDGDEVAFRWGPQGGTMIVPSLRTDVALDPGVDTPCVSVEVTNHEPEGGTAFEGFRSARFTLPASRDGDHIVLRDVFDQLGNDAIPRGTPLDLEVVVRGRRAAARGRLSLTIVPSGSEAQECEELPVIGEGCRYWQIPTTARILGVTPAGADEDTPRCPLASDGLVVEAEITVDPRYTACAITPTRTEELHVLSYLPSSACAERAGLVVGAELAVDYRVLFAGGCAPELPIAIPALEACIAECVGDR